MYIKKLSHLNTWRTPIHPWCRSLEFAKQYRRSVKKHRKSLTTIGQKMKKSYGFILGGPCGEDIDRLMRRKTRDNLLSFRVKGFVFDAELETMMPTNLHCAKVEVHAQKIARKGPKNSNASRLIYYLDSNQNALAGPRYEIVGYLTHDVNPGKVIEGEAALSGFRKQEMVRLHYDSQTRMGVIMLIEQEPPFHGHKEFVPLDENQKIIGDEDTLRAGSLYFLIDPTDDVARKRNFIKAELAKRKSANVH